MALIILIILVAAIIGYWVSQTAYNDVATGVGAFIFAVIIGLFLFVGVSATLSNQDSQLKAVPNFKVNLQQLSAGSQIQGSFFLGSGYIDNQQVYSYFSKDGNRYHLDSVYAEGTTIVEDAAASNAYLQCWKYVPKNRWILIGDFYDHYSCEAHVPSGSVLQNFNLQASGS